MKHYIALRTCFPGEEHKHLFAEEGANIEDYPKFATKAILTNIKLGSYLYNVTIPEGQEYYEISEGIFVASHIMVSKPQLVTLEVVNQLIIEGADPTINNYAPLIKSVKFNDFDLFTYYHNFHGLPLDANDNACLKLALENQGTRQRFIEYILKHTEPVTKPKFDFDEIVHSGDVDTIIDETIRLIKVTEDKINRLKIEQGYSNEPLTPISVTEYVEPEMECCVYDEILKFPCLSVDTNYSTLTQVKEPSIPRSVSPTFDSELTEDTMYIGDTMSNSLINDFGNLNFTEANPHVTYTEPSKQLPKSKKEKRFQIKQEKSTKKKEKKRFGVFQRRNKVDVVNFDEQPIML